MDAHAIGQARTVTVLVSTYQFSNSNLFKSPLNYHFIRISFTLINPSVLTYTISLQNYGENKGKG